MTDPSSDLFSGGGDRAAGADRTERAERGAAASQPRSAQVRERLLRTLRLDLIGPPPIWETSPSDPYLAEHLIRPPSVWYLTGFLVPVETPVEERRDEDADDDFDSGDEGGNNDDGQAESTPARKGFFPSSIGVSLLVPAGLDSIEATVSWGDYHEVELPEGGGTDPDDPREDSEEGGAGETGSDQSGSGEDGRSPDAPSDAAPAAPRRERSRANDGFRREQRTCTVTVPLTGSGPIELSIDDQLGDHRGGLRIEGVVRPANAAGLPAGTRSLSLFLVNRRLVDKGPAARFFAFQAALRVRSETPLIPRPDPRVALLDSATTDHDERVADLQYRDCEEFVVGHGVSAEAVVDEGGACREVRTRWIPAALVERVEPASTEGAELSMETLAACESAAAVRAAIGPLVTAYGEWIATQEARAAGISPPSRGDTARFLVAEAKVVAGSLAEGLAALDEPAVLRAFRIANEAMALQARRREARSRNTSPEAVDPPRWRPFQIAFLLLALGGIANAEAPARNRVDLLFFPTGGGKTEAYLGLAAFTIVLRRLRNPGIASAGVAVLMRYTLRLLTLDQLSRAAALICALEVIRERETDLGEWPFEIGLWVGRAATPNRLGRRGDSAPGTAVAKVRAFQNDSRRNEPPIPLESCPWCGTRFEAQNFRLEPDSSNPTDLKVNCANRSCHFTADRYLPIVAVDEPLYRRLPCFLIATIDKFASLPWVAESGALFGAVERHDRNGFYGRATPKVGRPLPEPVRNGLLPPELVIQDELHLISGPLGTIAGIYESSIEALCTAGDGERRIRPKIVASTATIRRATEQISALFDRSQVCVFPAPGIDRRDSFFARGAIEPTRSRLYAGIAAPGRSMKVAFLRTCRALLASAGKASTECGGGGNEGNPADPYMTLLGYFNSLRELGGSRRIVEDDVLAHVSRYARRVRKAPRESLFRNRRIAHDLVELTSRVNTGGIADAKRRLALRHGEKHAVDVALATNMISVGLDIVRLGLMVVLGQPKTAAEYIQATSRVGRLADKPGLVVTLLNPHKPRDRSHYERFPHFHATFYRSVESTSVTPWTPRALDRALAGALVALIRHRLPEMTPSNGAIRIRSYRSEAGALAMRFATRARDSESDPIKGEELHQQLVARIGKLLDEWQLLAEQADRTGVALRFETQEGGTMRLLRDILDPAAADPRSPEHLFRANRSMRDVEPTTFLFVKPLPPTAASSDA